MPHLDVVVQRQIADHFAVLVTRPAELVEHLLEIGQSAFVGMLLDDAVQGFTVFESLCVLVNERERANLIKRLFLACHERVVTTDSQKTTFLIKKALCVTHQYSVFATFLDHALL